MSDLRTTVALESIKTSADLILLIPARETKKHQRKGQGALRVPELKFNPVLISDISSAMRMV